MARIANVNIPSNAHVRIGLQHIYGIGNTLANKICTACHVDPSTKVKDLSDGELSRLRSEIDERYRSNIEGDLRRRILMNIRSLIDSGTNRGLRHRRKLPVRGQRTRTNARTRKGRQVRKIKARKK